MARNATRHWIHGIGTPLLVIACLGMAATSAAQPPLALYPPSLTSPPAAQSPPPGTLYEVQISDAFGQFYRSGYVPIRFTITRVAAPADRAETLFVGVINHSFSYNRGGECEFMKTVEFRPGETTSTVDLNVVINQNAWRATAVVSRDASLSTVPRSNLLAAVELPDWLTRSNQMGSPGPMVGLNLAFFSSKPSLDTACRITRYQLPAGKYVNGPVTQCLVRMGQTTGPRFQSLTQVLGDTSERQRHHPAPAALPQDPNVLAVAKVDYLFCGDLSEIPDTWVGLTRVDMVVLSADDLRLLATRWPGRLESLRQWVAVGGRLIVSDCGQDYARLPTILPNLTAGLADRPAWAVQEWSTPQPARLSTLVADFNAQTTRHPGATGSQAGRWSNQMVRHPLKTWLTTQSVLEDAVTEVGTGLEVARRIAQAQVPAAISRYGSGRIVATAHDLTACRPQDWAALLLCGLAHSDDLPFAAIGSANHSWTGMENFDVPNVGQPPRGLFLVLINLFAVLVGPVAFLLLNRMGRAHLLLAVVPGFALLVTIGIVGFTILQDGFSFRASRLSVTWLDSQRQVAWTQTNQAIYAGLAPDAYRLPVDTMYFDNSQADRRNSSRVRVLVDSQQQNVSGGRIRARTKHQVNTFSVASTNKSLRLLAANADNHLPPTDRQWQVHNHLGQELDLLIVKTSAGLLAARNVPPDEAVLLQDATDILKQWFSERESRSGSRHNALAEISFGHDDATGRLGRAFRLLEYGQGIVRELETNQFLAVVPDNELAQGLHDRPYYADQLHLIIGSCLMSRSARDAAELTVATEVEPDDPVEPLEQTQPVGESEEDTNVNQGNQGNQVVNVDDAENSELDPAARDAGDGDPQAANAPVLDKAPRQEPSDE